MNEGGSVKDYKSFVKVIVVLTRQLSMVRARVDNKNLEYALKMCGCSYLYVKINRITTSAYFCCHLIC